MNRRYVVGGVIAFFIFLLYLSSIYTGITGIVVDAETGQPIEGAVVLVEWTKTSGFGEYHTESYKVVEKVTDKRGKFTLPGIYTPLVDPPRITIYKKGYVAWNSAEIFPDNNKRTDFEWKNNTFLIEHYKSKYSHQNHTLFIRGAIRSSIGYKPIINEAYRWEALEALKEAKK